MILVPVSMERFVGPMILHFSLIKAKNEALLWIKMETETSRRLWSPDDVWIYLHVYISWMSLLFLFVCFRVTFHATFVCELARERSIYSL